MNIYRLTNGALKTGLTMVVSRVLCDVPRELGHLDVFLDILFEATVEDLAWSRFESVDHVW